VIRGANLPPGQVDAVLACYIDIASLPPGGGDEPSPYAEILTDSKGPSWADALADAALLGVPVSKLSRESLPSLRGIPCGAEPSNMSQDVPEDASPVESGETSPGISNMSPKKCKAYRKDGLPCRAYALKLSDLCLFHESDEITNLSEAQSHGGAAPRRTSFIGLDVLPAKMHSPVEFQAVLETFLRMQLAGAIPDRAAIRILRTLRIMRATFDAMDRRRDGLAALYDETLGSCLNAAPQIDDLLALQDEAERAEKIADAGAIRRAHLRANQEFGHNQPKPANGFATRNLSPSHPQSRFWLPGMPKL